LSVGSAAAGNIIIGGFTVSCILDNPDDSPALQEYKGADERVNFSKALYFFRRRALNFPSMPLFYRCFPNGTAVAHAFEWMGGEGAGA
jgi:hypothetical protein